MRIAVITGGPIYPEAADLVYGSDRVICADSGFDYCLANNIKPDEVFGDLDSISSEGKDYLSHSGIPVNMFPSHKDVTDTEICLEACPEGSEVILICSLTGRLDHVLTNMGLLLKYKKQGMDITASDGRTDVIPMTGEEKITIGGLNSEQVAISLVPFAADTVKGVTTENLLYPLENAELDPLGSLYVSNEPVEGSDSCSVSIREGNLLVMITPKV